MASKGSKTVLKQLTTLNDKLQNELKEMKMGIENLNKVVGLKDKMIQGFEKKD